MRQLLYQVGITPKVMCAALNIAFKNHPSDMIEIWAHSHKARAQAKEHYFIPLQQTCYRDVPVGVPISVCPLRLVCYSCNKT